MKLRTTCVVGLLLFGGMAQAQDVAPLGEEFQINVFNTGSQKKGEVAADEQGDFVVVWDSAYSDGDDPSNSIQGQRFDSSGTLVGSQFGVNSYTSSTQYSPSAALSPQGDFVVVWGSYGSYGADNSRSSVQAQRFASRPVMVDSFESGDLPAWSSTVQ